MNLRGVTFDLKSDNKEDISKSRSNSPYARQIEDESNRQHMGVVAQEVEAIIPEVVRTMDNGKKAVSYVELIGVLIEAVKEQQGQIEELKSLIPINRITTKAIQDKDSAISEKLLSVVLEDNQLFQNEPNPFTCDTEIRYTLDESVNRANLYIYDMQGKQIRNIDNLSRGSGSVKIEGHRLSAGMYIYTLIVDGKEVGTKRMILTK